MGHAIERAKRHGRVGAVLFIDLDQFKPVNDTLGHKTGDELLQAVASRLDGRKLEIDMLARLGRDEFVMVLEEITNQEAAATVAEDVIRQLKKPFTLTGGAEVRIGSSIGIALYPLYGDASVQLIERADQALYVTKGAGRGRYRYCEGVL